MRPYQEAQDYTRAEMAVARAFARGNRGFQGPAPSFQGQAVLDIRLDEEWDARDWVVTFAGVSDGGSQPGDLTGLTVGVPPDNQAATFLTSGGGNVPPEVANYLIAGLYMRVEWGAGNSRNHAYVSYPWGGGAFQLHAGALRVSFPAGLTAIANPGIRVPTIGGFVTVGNRSQSNMPPVLVTTTQSFGEGASVTFWAPPRAVGYRLYTHVDPDGTGVSVQYQAEQLFWNGAATRSSLDATNASVMRGNSNELDIGNAGATAAQRATSHAPDWTRLLPFSVGLMVSVPPVQSGLAEVGVEWVLDLG